LDYYPGGKGANQAVAAARLGEQVRMIGMLGDDAFAHPLRESLRSAGVDIRNTGSYSGSSGTAIIVTDSDGQNAIIVIPGANAQLLPEKMNEVAGEIRSAGIVLAQLETPLETIIRAAEIAAEAEIPFILDPAPARPLPQELFKHVTWLTPNETEAEQIIGRNAAKMTPEERIEALLAMGAKGIVLKMGERGAYVSGGDVSFLHVPAHVVRAVDTTAAGDAFNGAFAAALMRGNSIEQAVRFAVAASAVSVTRHGAQPSLPAESEVLDFLNANRLSAIS